MAAKKPKPPEYWSKDTPSVEGWYWMKYKNAERRYVECPAYVCIMRSAEITANHVRSAYNDKSIRFGARIPDPPA